MPKSAISCSQHIVNWSLICLFLSNLLVSKKLIAIIFGINVALCIVWSSKSTHKLKLYQYLSNPSELSWDYTTVFVGCCQYGLSLYTTLNLLFDTEKDTFFRQWAGSIYLYWVHAGARYLYMCTHCLLLRCSDFFWTRTIFCIAKVWTYIYAEPTPSHFSI